MNRFRISTPEGTRDLLSVSYTHLDVYKRQVQSMTNTDTRDAKATLAQIRALADAGCDIVRCAVPDMQAAEDVYKRQLLRCGSAQRLPSDRPQGG